MSHRVNMTLSDEGIKNTEELVEKLNVRSRTQAIETALALSEEIVAILSKGGEVVIIDENKNEKQLFIPGIKSA